MGVAYFDNPKEEQDLYAEIYARQKKYSQVKNSVTRDDSQRASAISKAYPNFSPDVISALTLLQVKPEAEVLQEVSKRIVENNQKGLLGKFGGGLKAGVRLGLLGLEDAYRSWVDRPINSFIASTFGDYKDQLTFQDAYAQSGSSTVRQALRQLKSGNRVNLGEGFIPDSDEFDPNNPNSKFYEEYKYMVQKGMDPDKAVQNINSYLGSPITDIDRRMQEESGVFSITTKDNQGNQVAMPISLGRATANLVMEPGSRPFNVMSGIIDAGKIMFLDPANYFLLGTKALTAGRRTLKPSEELVKNIMKKVHKGTPGKKGSKELTNAQKKQLGLNDTGIKKWVSGRRVEDYLEHDEGAEELINWLATNQNTHEFMNLTGVTDSEMLKKLKDIQYSTRPVENKVKAVRKLLNDEVLGNPISTPFGFGTRSPTKRGLGRALGGLTESLIPNVPEQLIGTGKLFGSAKIIKASLMDSGRIGQIIASYAADLPYRFLDIDQMDQTLHQMKLWMDQTTINQSDKTKILNKAIDLEDGDDLGLYEVAKEMMAVTNEDLIINGGVNPDDAKYFTSFFEDELPEYRKFWINQLTGEEVLGPTNKLKSAVIDGKPHGTPGPQLMTEFINRTIPLPDAGGLAKSYNTMGILRAKMTKSFAKGLEPGEVPGVFANRNKSAQQGIMSLAADKYYQEAWKPLVLLRGAWTIRVIGEEQIRMYARGFDTMFSRPQSWLASWIGGTDDARKVKRWSQRGVTYNDLLGDPFDDAQQFKEAASAMAGINNNMKFFGGEFTGRRKPGPHPFEVIDRRDITRFGANGQRTKQWKVWLQEWMTEANRINGDDLFKFLFRGADGEALSDAGQQRRLQEWINGKSEEVQSIMRAYQKGGPSYRRAVQGAGGRFAMADAIKARLTGHAGGVFDENKALLEKLMDITNPKDVDITKSPFPIMTNQRKANDDLLNILLGGEFGNGFKIDDLWLEYKKYGDTLTGKRKSGLKKKDSSINSMADVLDEVYEDLPVYQKTIKELFEDDPSRIKQFVEMGFKTLMGDRTDNLSRSPVFRQLYWRQIYEMLPYMSPSARHRILYGGTVRSEGRSVKLGGAVNAGIPDENLWSKIMGTPGTLLRGGKRTPMAGVKLRKRDTEINLDMLKRKIEELNKVDAEAGNVYVNFEKDIRAVEKKWRGKNRELKGEKEKYDRDRIWIFRGRHYAEGLLERVDPKTGDLGSTRKRRVSEERLGIGIRPTIDEAIEKVGDIDVDDYSMQTALRDAIPYNTKKQKDLYTIATGDGDDRFLYATEAEWDDLYDEALEEIQMYAEYYKEDLDEWTKYSKEEAKAFWKKHVHDKRDEIKERVIKETRDKKIESLRATGRTGYGEKSLRINFDDEIDELRREQARIVKPGTLGLHRLYEGDLKVLQFFPSEAPMEYPDKVFGDIYEFMHLKRWASFRKADFTVGSPSYQSKGSASDMTPYPLGDKLTEALKNLNRNFFKKKKITEIESEAEYVLIRDYILGDEMTMMDHTMSESALRKAIKTARQMRKKTKVASPKIDTVVPNEEFYLLRKQFLDGLEPGDVVEAGPNEWWMEFLEGLRDKGVKPGDDLWETLRDSRNDVTGSWGKLDEIFDLIGGDREALGSFQYNQKFYKRLGENADWTWQNLWDNFAYSGKNKWSEKQIASAKKANQADLDWVEELKGMVSRYREGRLSKVNAIEDKIKARMKVLDETVGEKSEKYQRGRRKYIREREKLYDAASFTEDVASFDQLDTVAKAVALQGVQDLLYDITRDNKFFYNMRAIFPFGNAYKEIVTTWAKLLKENPQMIRRGQVAVNALRKDNDFSPIEGEGFIGEDEVTGESVFYYPVVSELISEAASDVAFGEDRQVQVRFPGYASSLNIALSVVPGVGPMMAIPLAKLIGDSPAFDDFVKFAFPYGLPDVKTSGDLINAAFAPAWMRNAVRAIWGFDSDNPNNEIARVAGNTQIDIYRLLKANGELDDTQQQQIALQQKAKKIGRGITLIKAFSQFIGPTGMNPRYDKIGDPKNNTTVWAMQTLSDRYRELLETPPILPGTNQMAYAPGDNYSATKYFIDEFGFNPIDLVQPKSIVIEPRPVDEKGVEFQRNNPELFESHPYTAQFAIPKGGGGDFSYEAYVRTLVEGKREPLSPDEWLYKRNQSLGQFYMEDKRLESLELFDITRPNQDKARNRYLAMHQIDARDKFPGYDRPIPGLPETTSVELQMKELRTWEKEPQLANTKVGRDVISILSIMDTISKKGFREGLSMEGWRSSRRYIAERKFLRDTIARMVANNDDLYFVAEKVLLPYIEERRDFVEDLFYNPDVFEEYGMYLPNKINVGGA